ncbi:MAG: hypothetical protein K0S32_2125 [Bacteroidetes bacterium]|jgi:hypothetical protein|nr:hypothetical protein [Bacteroidota bacterium]
MKYLLIIFTFLVTSVFSQNEERALHKVSGNFKDDKQTGVPDIIVQLFNAKDSALMKTEFTDGSGNFIIEGVKTGSYFIIPTLAGYKKNAGKIFEVNNDLQLESVILEREGVELKEVTVTTRKPFIERDHGKVVLNVESSISAAGSSVFEVIEKAPGVVINNNDNIIFKGKGGVQIQIDGKPTPMTGADLANYLKGISASSVEKIEFIANPSSKYDAAGTAIINIKLKKDKRFGTNGTLTAGAGHGVYPKANGGFSINHRDKKVSLFANYNYSFRQGFNDLRLTRKFYRNDSMIGAYVQKNYLIFPFRNHVARVGGDYFINKKNTIGIVLNGVSNKFNPNGENTSDVIDHTGNVVSRFGTTNRSYDNWYNYSANLNFKHVFDSTGSELTSDVDYAHFGNHTEQNFLTRYYDLTGNEYLNPYYLYGDLNGNLDIYAAKVDYVKPMKKEFKLEAGAKSSFVQADNDLAFFNRSSGGNTFDTTKSNHFIYTENINAAYFNLFKETKKWSFQLGVRAEQTRVSGKQVIYNVTNDTSYLQLFPSAFVGYKANEKNGFELTYSRRINRPGYDQLNPFKFYLDPTTYKEGNPYLKPQTTHSWEFSHVFKQKIYTTLSYGRTTNNITEVISPSEKQLTITVQTNKNLATVDVYALNFSVPVEIFKWWYTQNDLGTYYGLYSGNIANTTISQRGNVAWNINSVNTFNITKNLSAELSGSYRAKEIYAYEFVNPIWSVSAGMQWRLLKNKATLRINASDVFFTNKISALAEFTGYKENFLVQRETRVVNVAFTYKFGNNGVKGVQRKAGAADDVKQRAGKGG